MTVDAGALPGDKRWELAYDAAVKSLSQQDSTLGNLRSRATGLLSAATVATSLGAGLGLYSNKASDATAYPAWAAGALILLVIALGGTCVAVLWPVRMCFGADAEKIKAKIAEGVPVDDVRSYVVDELLAGRAANSAALRKKFGLFRIAAGLLTAETVVFVAGLFL